MPSIGCQTQQFLTLLQHSEKLTALYLRIKGYQSEKQELLNKIQYMEFKNQALEKSLFQQQLRNRDKQSIKNSILIHEVIGLQEQIHKQNSIILQNSSRYSNSDNKNTNRHSKEKKRNSRQKVQENNLRKNGLVPILQQPQMQNTANSQVLQPKSTNNMSIKSTNKITPFIKPSHNIATHRSPNTITNNGTGPNSFPLKSQSSRQDYTGVNLTNVNNSSLSLVNNSQNKDIRQKYDLLTDRIGTLQKQLNKYQKNKKITQVEIKRLRKMNQQYAAKCKRLQKLVEARTQLYSNLKREDISLCNQLGVGISFNAAMLGEQDEDSLFQ